MPCIIPSMSVSDKAPRSDSLASVMTPVPLSEPAETEPPVPAKATVVGLLMKDWYPPMVRAPGFPDVPVALETLPVETISISMSRRISVPRFFNWYAYSSATPAWSTARRVPDTATVLPLICV